MPQTVADQVLKQSRSRQAYCQIAEHLPVTPSNIARLLRRAGLHRLADLEPAIPENRHEDDRPEQQLHLDTKKLTRFRLLGHYVTGNRHDLSG